MKETEITVQVFEDVDKVKNKLINRGFKIAEEFLMIDYYYSKYSIEELKGFDYKKLLENSFLVRKVLSQSKTCTLLLYKDKVIDEDNNVIAEQKYSCDIENEEMALKIFESAKLTCWCELKQKSFVFTNDKVCFVLQDVEDLGLFIEYEEDEDIMMLNEYEKIEILLNRLKALDLNLGDNYSCKKVFMKFNKN
ncbi:MAG: hypothetical protein IJW59_02285 [Clostridia bacterium]|nr:hypothetical protein [Clostridia bacterium]